MARLVEKVVIEPTHDIRLTQRELNTVLAAMGAVPAIDVIKMNYNLNKRNVLETGDYTNLYVALCKIAGEEKK